MAVYDELQGLVVIIQQAVNGLFINKKIFKQSNQSNWNKAEIEPTVVNIIDDTNEKRVLMDKKF